MSIPNALRFERGNHLSVIYKTTESGYADSQHHAVVQTDLNFNITGWNSVAEHLHGQPGAMGKNLFVLADLQFCNSSREELIKNLKEKGFWSGEVKYKRKDGKEFDLQASATYIINEYEEPVAVMIVSHIINDLKLKEQELLASESRFKALVNSLPDGVMMIGRDGKILNCNKRAAEIFGLSDDQVTGNSVTGHGWKAVRTDGSDFPQEQFPAVVSLQTGFPQRNVIMGVEKKDAGMVWISVNSEALIRPGEFEPYAVVVSFSDITRFITSEKALIKSNERFHYITRITSDAIWDIDLITNEIYRSEAFSRLSGYAPEEIGNNLNWWFDKIHPEDQARVKSKLEEIINAKEERWEDEYRFIYADGTYKILNDSGIILYNNGKAVRILGAIRDVTEEKRLKQQLAEEQEKKQKAVTCAALQAQEQEKARISRELHDNVNQILMSAKLYMETSRQTPEKSDALIQKAIEYQMLALHEIRKLSRSLSTPGITTTGIKDSIGDIVNNLRALQQINVEFTVDPEAENRLSDEQKLTIYRVVQEQSNNIIKYAQARNVKIDIKKADDKIFLTISDDGKGFDTQACQVSKGIGFINMNSRAIAVNGKFSVTSSPGNGCCIMLDFPLTLF